MKLPLTPPPWLELAREHATDFGKILVQLIGPEVRGKYEHWDHLRHLTPPSGLSLEQWWLGIKIARQSIARPLPLRDKNGHPFQVSLSDSLQRRLFQISRDASGALKGIDHHEDESVKSRYLMRSVMEEAMTSSQLEGAATTTAIAKDMLTTGRAPRDYGEKMIYNNYATMRELKRWVSAPLTPDTVFEIHRMLTDGTLQEPGWAGRFRTDLDNIVISDEIGNQLHVPPRAEELPGRLETLCRFANESDESGFLHPVVRAILIHFQIGYDHPFCDGNGRTARALFYWSMLRAGFWMMEFISISSILKKAQSKYVRAYLYSETDDSDATYFIDHQLDVILEAIDSLHDYLSRKQKIQSQIETLLRPGSRLARKLNHRQRALLLNALRHPDKPFTIEGHRRSHAVTYATARSDLLGLADAKLVTKDKYGRSFVFYPVPDLSEKLKK